MKRINFIKNEKGSSLVQFILVFPVFISIIALSFDIGSAVESKTNLQYLVSEIEKSLILYEEHGVTGGAMQYLEEKTIEDQLLKLAEIQNGLDKDELDIKIEWSDTISKVYTGHYHSLEDDNFHRQNNRTDIKYVEVTGTYNHKFHMFLTRALIGDQIKLKQKYAGIVYAGGDGWDE